MRSKDPELMSRMLNYINEYYFSDQRMPSVQTIAAAMDISKSSVHRYLNEMSSRGILSYSSGKIHTEKVSSLGFASTNAPIMGCIACGEPVPEEQQFMEYVPLPTVIFGEGDLYILKACGDSMVKAGISSGDWVVIRRQNTAKINDIVVALVDHHETTLKRLLYNEELHREYLHPENDSMEDMYFSEIEIQGILTRIIKNPV